MSSFDDITRASPQLKINIPQRLDANNPLPPLPIHYCDAISRGIHFTPEKIDLIARDLSECRVNAAFVTKNMTDQGRIIRYIADIQDALATRQQDILFYLERVSTPYLKSPSSRTDSPTTAVHLSPPAIDPSPNALSHSLFELQERVALLNDKLKGYRIRSMAFFDLGRRKDRLLELTLAIHDSWINLV